MQSTGQTSSGQAR